MAGSRKVIMVSVLRLVRLYGFLRVALFRAFRT